MEGLGSFLCEWGLISFFFFFFAFWSKVSLIPTLLQRARSTEAVSGKPPREVGYGHGAFIESGCHEIRITKATESLAVDLVYVWASPLARYDIQKSLFFFIFYLLWIGGGAPPSLSLSP